MGNELNGLRIHEHSQLSKYYLLLAFPVAHSVLCKGGWVHTEKGMLNMSVELQISSGWEGFTSLLVVIVPALSIFHSLNVLSQSVLIFLL